MPNVQPNNIVTGNIQDFHPDGSVKLSIEDTVLTENTQMGFTDDGRVRISGDLPLFADSIEGSSLNTNLWATSVSTMTIGQASGIITLNSGSSLASGAYAILSSNKQFLRWVGNAQFFQGVLSWLSANQASWPAGAVAEFGLANFSGVIVNASDGIFIRTNSAGDTYIVQSFNGQEDAVELVFSKTGLSFVPVSGHFYLTEIIITDEHIHVELVDLGTSLELPEETTLVAQTVPFLSTRPGAYLVSHIPISARLYNLAATLTTAQFFIGAVEVTQLDMIAPREYGEMLAVNQKGAYQGPNITAGLTQTANHANSTSPTSASLSNTVAGYTTLGGRYQFAAPAGAATDYCLFGYQVPAGVDLIIKGLRISAVNTGAAVATTATIMDWSIAVNSSAVSLATVEGAGTWAPRRIPVGVQSFIVGAAIGASPGDEVITFATPIVCNGGRFVQIIVQIPVGTATGSQVIRGDVFINGYFE
jgi:hypothetical protein